MPKAVSTTSLKGQRTDERLWSLRDLKSAVRCDAMLLGLFSPSSPQPDEVLACDGFRASSVKKWLQSEPAIPPFSAGGACRPIQLNDKGAPTMLSGQHGVIAMLPDVHPHDRQWYLAIGRKSGVFNEGELSLAALQLARWQQRLLFPRPSVLQRLVLARDMTLIGADVNTRAQLIAKPDVLHELVTSLRLVLDQRYPKLADDEPHDFLCSLAGQTRWVHCDRRSLLGSRQWMVEIRPVDDDELPPVAAVADERVAAALAFIHDRFSQTPSLEQIAKHVRMSPFHFHRLFSKMAGVSPKKYQLHWQLAVSRWMLRDPMVPIGSIAMHAGFSSHGHFTSTFHRLVGLSPTAFREQHAE